MGMNLKHCILFLGVFILYSVSGFTIIPYSLQPIDEGENATFSYRIWPWPPPCCRPNDTDYDKYLQVTVNFYNVTSGDKLCDVTYVKGKWDETTGKCSSYNNRMFDYRPEMEEHIRFHLYDLNIWDQSSYRMEVLYGENTASSDIDLTVYVTPPNPELVRTAYGNLTVGSYINITCSVSLASPPAQLTWTRGFHVIHPDPNNYTVAEAWDEESRSGIRVGPLSREDHGDTYMCEATSIAGASSSSTTLTLLYEPYVQMYPCMQYDTRTNYVIAGSTALFSCKINANPGVVNDIRWMRDFQVVDYAPPNETDYHISSVTPDMDGLYTCAVENALGSGIGNCSLSVLYGASVDIPGTVEVNHHGDLSIHCATDGNPAVSQVRWIKSGDADFEMRWETLNISSVQPQDAGSYTCLATNIMNPTLGPPQTYTDRKTVQVFVIYEPTWTEYALQRFTGVIGEQSELRCRSNGYPAQTFTWRRNGNTITENANTAIITEGDVSTLSLTNVQQGDLGDYQCHVTNSAGSSTFNIELLEPGEPDPPQACVIRGLEARRAELSCIPGYNGGDTPNLLVLHATNGREKELDSEVALSDGIYMVNISGLAPNVNYTVEIYTENSHGRSESGCSIVVSTLDGPPLPTSPPPDVAAIVGGVIGGLVALALIIGVIIYVKQNGPPSVPKSVKQMMKKKEKTRCKYTAGDEIGFRYGDRDVRSKPSGKDNEAFLHDESRAAPNHYVPHPGVTRLEFTPGTAERYVNRGYSMDDDTDDNEEQHRVRFQADVHVMGQGQGEGQRQGQHQGQAQNQVQMRRQRVQPRRREEQFNSATSLTGIGAGTRLDASQLEHRNSRNSRTSQPPPDVATNTSHRMPPGGANNSNHRMPPGGANQRISQQYPDVRHSQQYPTGHAAALPSQDTTRSSNMYPDINIRSYRQDDWELDRDILDFSHQIGEGYFSEVWKAAAENLNDKRGREVVAVKMLKDNCPSEEQGTLIRELQLMKTLKPHPNIISLIGCCTREDPLMIVMQFAPRGNLLDFLRANRHVTYHTMTSQGQMVLTNRHQVVFALSVANGMEYIASKELLHRDLAARNVLLDDRLGAKISDFGFARDVAYTRQYESTTRRRMPLRWMAPESLFDNLYTSKSDVWSFGILLWEIVTMGSSPYPGMNGHDVMDLIQSGYRIDKPKHCSDALYALMRDCWRPNPSQRPSFALLRDRLDAILEDLDDNPGSIVHVARMSENMMEILVDIPGEKT